MNPNATFERELERWLGAEAPASAPDGLHAAVIDRARTMRQRRSWATSGLARWLGRNRGLTLLAAASLLLLGGVAAAGAGLLRFPAVVPPVPAPSFAAVADATASPTDSPSPAPSATPVPVPPKPGMFAYILPAVYPTYGLWVSNMDGTGARRLAKDLGGSLGTPAWSPDGARLVFSREDIAGDGYPNGYFRLYLTDAAGSQPQLVDTGCVAPCIGDSDAAFSSDGNHLVFVRKVSGGAGGAGRVLATIDLTTGRVAELASTAVSDSTGDFQGFDAPAVYHPRWSPDGTQIVFTQDVPNDVSGRVSEFGPLPGAFVVDADGGNLRQVGPAAQTADWSPDGARIAFGSVSITDVPRAGSALGLLQYFDIYTVRPDGTDLRRLTTDRISSGPTWTADGRIGFLRVPLEQTRQGEINKIGPTQFWIMDADGGNATQLSVSGKLTDQASPISWPPQP